MQNSSNKKKSELNLGSLSLSYLARVMTLELEYSVSRIVIDIRYAGVVVG